MDTPLPSSTYSIKAVNISTVLLVHSLPIVVSHRRPLRLVPGYITGRQSQLFLAVNFKWSTDRITFLFSRHQHLSLHPLHPPDPKIKGPARGVVTWGCTATLLSTGPVPVWRCPVCDHICLISVPPVTSTTPATLPHCTLLWHVYSLNFTLSPFLHAGFFPSVWVITVLFSYLKALLTILFSVLTPQKYPFESVDLLPDINLSALT